MVYGSWPASADRLYSLLTGLMLDNYIKDIPLIAILRGITPDEAVSVSEILVEAGIAVIEVPLNSADACTSIKILAKRYRNEALIGAGTVLNVSEVTTVQQAGARLVVSPNTDVAVISAAKRLNMVSIPGSCTPTEILGAIAAGADAVKLFPAEIISPIAVKAIRAVLPPGFRLFAVGGVNSENMPDYIRGGIHGFGIGSTLYKRGKSLSEIRRDTGLLVSAYRNST